MHRFTAALAAAFLCSSAAIAQEDPAASFGARENIESISLSPDGSKIAFVSPIGGQGSVLYTTDASGAGAQPVRALQLDGDPERLSRCGWVSNARLVCSIHMLANTEGMPLEYSRLIAVDADGGNPKLVSARHSSRALYITQWGGGVLDWLPEQDGAVLKTRVYVPESTNGTRLAEDKQGLGVEQIDTMTLATKRIESPKRDAVEFISDGHGTIRIMGTRPPKGASVYSGEIINYFYRAGGSEEWKPLSEVNVDTDEGFSPAAVDRDLNAVYGLRRKDGRMALYRIALDGSMREELVYAHPQVDVDGLVQIGRHHRVVGVTFATEKRQTIFFDPALKSLAAALSKALPGLPLISFVDASLDESKLLLWAGSDIDPGRYYVFDKAAKKLNEVLLARPQLEGVTLAAVKPVTYKAADGTMVPGYLTLPPGSTGKGLPAIVMPHGGPGARDEWGFDWLAQYFANRGYAVLQPNFRGSWGYGDQWFRKNGFQSWRTAIGDINDGGRWLVSEGIADRSKLAILGWSYGGYAALQSAVLDPALFKAIVAIAPVTDLAALRNDARMFTNFRSVDTFIGTGPHVQEGSPAQNAAKIKAPVLMFHGEMDRNVEISQARLMSEKLAVSGKTQELVIFPKLDHYLEDSGSRALMLGKSDAFLRASLGL